MQYTKLERGHTSVTDGLQHNHWSADQISYLSELGKTGVLIKLPFTLGNRFLFDSYRGKTEIIVRGDGASYEAFLYRERGQMDSGEGFGRSYLYRFLKKDEESLHPSFDVTSVTKIYPPKFTTELPPFLIVKSERDTNDISLNDFELELGCAQTLTCRILFDHKHRPRQTVEMIYGDRNFHQDDRSVLKLTTCEEHEWDPVGELPALLVRSI